MSRMPEVVSTFEKIMDILGVDFMLPKLTSELKDSYNSWIEARNSKDYESADKYRNLLAENGII